ncbi:MAG: 30S ribosomal protein S2 [Lentisphaeria bacterium]
MADTITINDLLEAGVHFGHQTRRWNPKMKPYIYGARNGISIFDLTKTIRMLADACEFLRETAADGGKILFVGSKRQAQEIVKEAAERTGQSHMCDRWLGGTLTNNSVILTRVEYLKDLERRLADGSLEKLPKKEQSKLRKEYEKLKKTLGGITELNGLPKVMVVIDVLHEAIAVREANRLNIPVVAVVDSNCDPDSIAKVVPGNDDALRAIKVLMDAFSAAIEEGRMTLGKSEAKEDVLAAKGDEEVAAPTEA